MQRSIGGSARRREDGPDARDGGRVPNIALTRKLGDRGHPQDRIVLLADGAEAARQAAEPGQGGQGRIDLDVTLEGLTPIAHSPTS
jgi:hypothetical protein